MFDAFFDYVIHVLPSWLQGFIVGLLAGFLLTLWAFWFFGVGAN